MSNVPKSLEETIIQAKEATVKALEAGYGRLQIEIVIPEIALKAQALALEFSSIFEDYGSGLKILFPDTGAASLARRDWGETTFRVSDLGSSRMPVENKIADEDQIFLVVCPSAVEVSQVEKLCNLAVDRPVVLLIPQLEDISIVGIGYAARQLRERFLSTLETCYYLRPMEESVVMRCYPSLWQVWVEKGEEYELIAEEPQKPMGDNLELILKGKAEPEMASSGKIPPQKKQNIFGGLQKFLRALSK